MWPEITSWPLACRPPGLGVYFGRDYDCRRKSSPIPCSGLWVGTMGEIRRLVISRAILETRFRGREVRIDSTVIEADPAPARRLSGSAC